MDEIFKQDLSKEDENSNGFFGVHLLMKEPCDMPDSEFMSQILKQYLGRVECVSEGKSGANFILHDYQISNQNKAMPVMAMIAVCAKRADEIMDELSLSQTWDCPQSREILQSCPYTIFATDVLSRGLEARQRAMMIVAYIEALIRIFPSCEAVIMPSKKMLLREQILNCDLRSVEDRFIHHALNVRFFSIQGTNDMVVDSLGMSAVFMPDLQFHFHTLNPHEIVSYAYDILKYMLLNDNPFKSGHTLAGIKDGKLDTQIKWKIQLENSLIQPSRDVFDVNTAEFAAGVREV